MPDRRSTPEAGFLLIDLSNSFTKLAPATRERLGRVTRLPTRTLTARAVREAVGAWTGGTVVLSSVVPEKAKVIRTALRGHRIVEVGPGIALGVGIDFPKPETIGADRLANAASAAALHGAPAVVVDFGTAVTFDIVSREKKYVGGVIAPGLEVMTDYLYQRTALLPRIDLLEPVSAIGKSTRDAMMAGAVYGYRGLVREILAQIRAELRVRRLKVIATGGYASLIAAKLPEIHLVDPHLTLEGLRIIGGLNCPK